ncbi:CotH kinase family protein [bacterium]|nr:CotH kinase family protein [bacterium]
MKKIFNGTVRSFFCLVLFAAITFLAVGCNDAKSGPETDADSSDPVISDADTSDADTSDAGTSDEDTAGSRDEDNTDSENENSDADTPEESGDPDNQQTGNDGDVIPEPSDHDSQSGSPDDDTAVSGALFVRQPKKMNIAPNNRRIALTCEAEAENGEITYQWYESQDGSTDTGIVISGATGTIFNTPVFNEKGIRYYFCTATVSGADDTVLVSDVASVANTALPTLFIETPNNAEITSKEDWITGARISLTGTEESWNFENVPTSIRGRGNSTWLLSKKPYALKLDKKQQIMGLPTHKRWVLIANYLDNTFMRNETAFYLSRIFEFDWTVRGDFVDLVLNGEYQGLYWLGEAIKVSRNRVDIDDGNEDMTDDEDKDYLVEMDKYFDEPVKFQSPIRNLPYMIKNDDYMVDGNGVITSGGAARLERFQAKIDTLEKLLYPKFTPGSDTNNSPAPDETYANVIDIESWAKFWFVNEIMDNTELRHPKSCYFTFDSTHNIFKAGPVWDFDCSSLYNRSSCILKETIYYNALFKSPAFKAKVKELWNGYSGSIDIEPLIESMRSRLALAAEYDTMLWGEHDDPSGVRRENFDAYVDFFKARVLSKISVVAADVSAME